MHQFYQTKSNTLVLKDVDPAKRRVEGYFSAFGNIDSDNDIIEQGAFAKSLSENGVNSSKPRIKHLYQHSWDKPIGKLIELTEDSIGLKFVSEISKSRLGEDVLKMYQEGILTEHSVGFRTIKSDTRQDGVNVIKEAQLWEGSTVTWGANADTPVIGIKSLLNAEDPLKAVNDRMNKLCSIVRKGSGLMDETFETLEIELKQIQQLYNSLLQKEVEKSLKEQETIDLAAVWRDINSN